MGDEAFYSQIKRSSAERETGLPDKVLPPEFKSIGELSMPIVDRAQTVHELALTIIAAGTDLNDEPRCLETALAFKSITGVPRPREIVLDCLNDARAHAVQLIREGVSLDAHG